MLTLPITYINFNGKPVTRNFFFNITQAEIALRELESDGTWSETLEQIKQSNQGSVVMPEFKKIIKWCYGEKSLDGESFEKSDAIWQKFENSEPWSVLIMNLLTGDGFAADFIKGVMPPQATDGVTPGFRPGADVSRPTPLGAQSATPPVPDIPVSPTSRSLPGIAEPVLPEPVGAVDVPSTPDVPQASPTQEPATAEPVSASTPVAASVDPTPAPVENPVEQTSTPRTDLIGGIS